MNSTSITEPEQDATMTLPRFIQIHTLHNYPAALLNRDDAGLAKRLPYGGAVRTRISSQCLKRHWRVADDAFALERLGVPMATRTRYVAELVRQRLVEQGIDEPRAFVSAEALLEGLFGEKPDKKKEGAKALQTGQAVLFGNEEIAYFTRRCRDIAGDFAEPAAIKAEVAKFLKGEKKNIETMKLGSGLESALFGRMVTSDALANRDASVSVAHAFTVHEAQVENDYFTVVDDFAQEEDGAGSAGIFDTELASGLYYGYVVVDVPQLVANLEGVHPKEAFAIDADKRALAGKVTQHLLHLIATVSPGAKRGSTAPYDWAKFVLVEAGDWQPRSLAAAFHDPLPLKSKDAAPIRARAVGKLAAELGALDAAYGMPTARRFLALDEVAVPGAARATLSQLGEWVAQTVRAGEC